MSELKLYERWLKSIIGTENKLRYNSDEWHEMRQISTDFDRFLVMQLGPINVSSLWRVAISISNSDCSPVGISRIIYLRIELSTAKRGYERDKDFFHFWFNCGLWNTLMREMYWTCQCRTLGFGDRSDRYCWDEHFKINAQLSIDIRKCSSLLFAETTWFDKAAEDRELKWF